MKENEISVTFHCDKVLMDKFEKAIIQKAQALGIMLSKKQAIQLAMKLAIEKWENE